MIGTATNSGGASAPRPQSAAAKTIVVLAAIIRYWALLGGVVVALVAIMTSYSAVSHVLFHKPFAPEHELVKHFVGIAIFMFLPYCQLVGANVTVDIFTESMSEAKKAMMEIFASLFALAFSVLLLRQMYLGFQSYQRFPEVTPVLKLPLWTAFPPILFSLFLLLIASLITIIEGVRHIRGQTPLIKHSTEIPNE